MKVNYSLYHFIDTTIVKSGDEKDDILNLLKSQITDTAASRDKASKVLCSVSSMYSGKFSIQMVNTKCI